MPIAIALQLGPAPESATLIDTGLHVVVALLLGTATRLLLAPLQPPSRATMSR
jgi:hypothetical protein